MTHPPEIDPLAQMRRLELEIARRRLGGDSNTVELSSPVDPADLFGAMHNPGNGYLPDGRRVHFATVEENRDAWRDYEAREAAEKDRLVREYEARQQREREAMADRLSGRRR
jgi:hypothetical protein